MNGTVTPYLKTSVAIGALTVSGLLAAPLAAQTDLSAQTDFAVTDDTAFELESIMVQSASGGETTVQDAPASISVIDAAAIEKEGARELTEVLRKIPGLNLTRGNSGTHDVSFRGLSSNRTLMLIDGRRVSSSGAMLRDYQGDLNNIPLDAIDRIEVVRGPMSTLYGSDAMGGVINIILKEPTDIWSGSVSAEYSASQSDTTAPSKQLSAFFGGAVSDTVTLSFRGKYTHQDAPEPYETTVQDNGRVSQSFSTLGVEVKQIGASLTWRASDVSEWTMDLDHTRENYLAYEAHDGNRLDKTGVALGHEWLLGAGSLNTYLRFEKTSNEYWNSDDLAWNDPIEYETLTLASRYNNSTFIGARALDYTFGLEVARDELVDSQTNRNGAEIGGDVVTGALYGEGRLQLTDALKLTGGLRVDQHEDFGTHVTPRIYANYDFGGGLMLKAGYAQAFVAPGLRSMNPDYMIASRGNGCRPYSGPCQIIGNPDLEPETSDNFEIGLNYQGEGLSWELTAFYNEVEDMFGAQKTGDTVDLGGVTGDVFQRTNIDEGRTGGIEGGLSMDLSPDLTWSGTFTWLAVSEYKYDFSDRSYPMSTTPELNLTTGLTWQASDRVTLGGQITYVGAQAGYVSAEEVAEDEANAVPAGQNSDSYYLVDVTASIDLGNDAQLNLGIDNLFDSQPDSDVSYRENDRLFRVGLTKRF